MSNPLAGIRGGPPPITREPLTAVVTKRTSEGVYVAPLGGDHRTPVGPCRGGTMLKVGDACLLVWTQELPWAVADVDATPDTAAEMQRRLDAQNLVALRRWHAAAAGAQSMPADVLHVGDSITEGWTGGAGPDDQTGMVLRTQLAQRLNTSGLYGRWIPAGGDWYPTAERFSANGAAGEVNNGLSLRGRRMPAGAPPATATQTCDRIRVYYRVVNAFAVGHVRIKIDGVVVHEAPTFKNTGPYCSQPYGEEVVVFDSGPLTRGPHTLSVEQLTVGGFNGPMAWDGAYFHDGDHTAGVRYWNASHFGYNYATYNANDRPDLNIGWLSAIRQGLLRPALVIGSHGINEDTHAAYDTNLRAWVASVRAAYGTDLPPSIALEVPPCTGTKDPAAWALMREVVYAAAVDLGCAVWDWGLLTGDVGAASGDPLGLTVDGIHLNSRGHRMRGRWLAARILREVSTAVALPGPQGPQGIKGDKGDPGDSGAWELRGTGMPEGVVTAAVGAYYTDTAATNGAIRWVKASGAGSTGWRVLHGETGWRDITATLTGITSGRVLIKREGNLVSLALEAVLLTAGSGTLTLTSTLHAGFRPPHPVSQRVNRQTSAAIAQNLWVSGPTLAWLSQSYIGEGVTQTNTRPTEGIGGVIAYPTVAAWPTTLPGTPA